MQLKKKHTVQHYSFSGAVNKSSIVSKGFTARSDKEEATENHKHWNESVSCFRPGVMTAADSGD